MARFRAARFAWGLSPRVRGSPVLVDKPGERLRSIPACAGEPAGPILCRVSRRVYPRVCGGAAHETVVPQMERTRGLSPRVRGSLPPPILADSPCAWGLSPRVRGSLQDSTDTTFRRGFSGLSPRVRGSPLRRRCLRMPHRWVYPRVCGGAILSRRLRLVGLGSIPACAGEPSTWPPSIATFPVTGVYPRVCGGASSTSARCHRQGVYPRVRGSPQARSDPDQGHGSIPACAGEPSLGR